MSNVQVKLNKAGVRELLRSGEVMDMLKSEAVERAGVAGTGYTVNTFVGRNRCNAEIVAETYEARRDNLKNNTLLRVMS